MATVLKLFNYRVHSDYLKCLQNHVFYVGNSIVLTFLFSNKKRELNSSLCADLKKNLLAAETKLLAELGMAVFVLALQIGKKVATLGNHAEHAATAVMVLLVNCEMTLQMIDLSGKKSYLNFRRTGITLGTGIFGYDLSLCFGA